MKIGNKIQQICQKLNEIKKKIDIFALVNSS